MVKVREALSLAMPLLGNAAAHISTERRNNMMKHLNKDLRPLWVGDFSNKPISLVKSLGPEPIVLGIKFGTF